MRLKEFLKEMHPDEERTEPYLDRQTDYNAPPRDDGDDSYDYEETETLHGTVSDMTKESMKDMQKAIGMAYDRLLSDFNGQKSEAARLIQDVAEDALRTTLGSNMRH